MSLQATSVVQPPGETDLHRFYEYHAKGITLDERGRVATRTKDFNINNVVFSATPLAADEMFEIVINNLWKHLAGTIAVGISEVRPSNNNVLSDCYYLTGENNIISDKIN